MGRRLLPALLLALLAAASSQAAPEGWGLGAMAGEPTGATLKHWLDQDESLAFGVGINPFSGFTPQAHADYLLHLHDVGRQLNQPSASLVTGLGLAAYGEDGGGSLEMGLRFPVGLSWFRDARTEWFAEAVPVFGFAPAWKLGFNASIGVRFYR